MKKISKVKKILSEQINFIKPEKEVFEKIKEISLEFCLGLEKKLKAKKIKAEVFIGGSLAKGTLIKKDKYDIDIFIRFDEKYRDKDISGLLESAIEKKARKIHGSRDYYQIARGNTIIEIIPVIKIKKPEEAGNITDLSYFHVNYVLAKIKKNEKLIDEILFAKAFAHAQDCYGAESYIHGFSGYSLELLIIHYKTFLNFIKEITNSKINIREKLIIDERGFFGEKEKVLMEMNEAKLKSPIVLVDPTFKERNVLAGLSKETFLKFQEACRKFLEKPGPAFFKKKDILKELKKYKNLKIITVKTNKQEGDIAGTKSKKFFNFFISKSKKEFEVKKNVFDYNEYKNIAYFYLIVKKKKDEIIRGPPITSAENLTRFKEVHANAFIEKQYAYAKISHDLSFEKFFKIFNKKEKKVMKDMGIEEMKLIK